MGYIPPSSGGVTDHNDLTNKGVNTHAQIDSHIGSTVNPHSTSDANLVLTDVTTNNVSTAKHGFCPKLNNDPATFLNGQGNWATPSGGSGGGKGAYTFLIEKSGSTYTAYNLNGGVGDSGTDFNVVIAYCLTQCTNKGFIQLKANTTYVLTSALSIVGLGTDWNNPSTQLFICGEGYSTIIDQIGLNANGIELSNGAHVHLQNFTLNMRTTSSGHGIYGLDTGANSKESITYSYIGEIIIQGVDSTHSAMYIKNPFCSDFGLIRTTSETCQNAVIFEATDTTGLYVGNCHFQHLICYSSASGGYALTLQALTSGTYPAVLNLMSFSHIDAFVAGGSILLKARNGGRVQSNWFYNLDLEGNQTNVMHDLGSGGSQGYGIITGNYYKGYIQIASGQIGIDCSTTNQSYTGGGANLFDFDVYFEGDKILIDDVGYYTPNEYRLRVDSPAAAQFTIGTNSRPKITWQGRSGGTMLKNPNSGSAANVADGGTITHNLGIEPDYVDAKASVAGEFVSITAKSATTFTVAIKKHDGTSGTSQTIYWRASWRGD